MTNDEIGKLRPLQQLAMCLGRLSESGRDDRRRCDAPQLQLNTVVETPRRAGASVSNAVNDGGTCGQIINHFRGRRLSGLGLFETHEACVTESARQPLLKMIQ
jgi:hypothetical protein